MDHDDARAGEMRGVLLGLLLSFGGLGVFLAIVVSVGSHGAAPCVTSDAAYCEQVYLRCMSGEWHSSGAYRSYLDVDDRGTTYGAVTLGAIVRAFRLRLEYATLGGVLHFEGRDEFGWATCTCCVNDDLSEFTVEWRTEDGVHMGPVRMRHLGPAGDEAHGQAIAMRDAIAGIKEPR